LPLHDFFVALKKNNFLVTPEQITDANRIISQYASAVKNEQELCHYLSPVFANSQEEQLQFREIFDEFYTPRAEKIAAKALKVAAPADKPGRFKKHGWKYLFGFLLVAAIAMWVISIIPPRKEPAISDLSITANTHLSDPEFKTSTNRPAGKQLDLQWVINDSIEDVTLRSKVDWGDGSAMDSLDHHIYKTEGIYTLTGYVDIFWRGKFQYSDTLRTVIDICFNPASIIISSSLTGDSVKLNEEAIFDAQINGPVPDSLNWRSMIPMKSAEISSVTKKGNTRYSQRFYEEGEVTLQCTAFYGTTGSSCITTSTVTFTVYDPAPKPRISFHPATNANKIRFRQRVLPFWFYMAGILAVISLALSVFFSLRWNRTRKKAPGGSGKAIRQYDEMRRSFSGKTGSVDIPFAGKNYLPLPEPELGDVARFMRRRISDDATYMHVQKTISKAIRNAGFFDPVMDTRMQQSEFLVLIDTRHDNDQQVKLFEFLLDLLKKQNVFVEKYHFRNEPLLCYRDTDNETISLEKLSEKYPEHILLILGNGHQLIDPDYLVFKQSYRGLLSRWSYKAVMTPVSCSDWGNKEKKILLPEIPVFPVDLPGLELMMHKLFGEEVNILAELYQHSDAFYETETVDFEDKDELAEYCNGAEWACVPGARPYDNILFQWIAALAVYPKLKWELILATGKAILDQYGCPEQLNYTNLLRITRISWMKAGKMPDYLRLNLLKELSKENEITAREIILSMLNEIPAAELNRDHFAFEEKETQRLINEFNLYACNPVKYAAYKESHDLFARMHLNGELTDLTVKTYLDNNDLGWKTLISADAKTPSGGPDPEKVRLTDYLGHPAGKNSWLNRIYLWAASIASLLFVFSVLGLILFTILHLTGSFRLSPFTHTKDFNKNILFNYVQPADDSLRKDLVLTVDTTEITLTHGNAKSKGTDETGTVMTLVADSSFKQVTISWNGKDLLDTLVQITHDSYTIEVLPALPDTTKTEKSSAHPSVLFIIPELCMDGTEGRFHAVVTNIDPAIKIRDSIDKERAKPQLKFDNDCLDRIAIGSKVDKNLADRIIKGFYKLALNLEYDGKDRNAVIPGANEIIIYNSKLAQVDQKPVVFIQVSSDSLVSGANRFRDRLGLFGFTVRPVEVKGNNFSSGIYYYSPQMEKYAMAINVEFARQYRGMQAKVQQVNSPDPRFANENSILVRIQKSDKKVLDGTNVTQVQYWNKDGSVIGDFYVNPKTGQWEEYNNDPVNYGKTKYYNLYSRDKDKIILVSATEKLSIHIELNRKKIMLHEDPNARELYEIVRISDDPKPVLSNFPRPVEVDSSKQVLTEFTYKNIYFATGSNKLLAQSLRRLDDIVRIMLDNPSYKLDVASHTDDQGQDVLNLQLTQQRAESVKAYLVSKGIDAGRITAIGYGESRPVADNRTAAGRARNRRTELTLKTD